jgi:hypothetical protein
VAIAAEITGLDVAIFVVLNGWAWSRQPGIDEAEATVIAVASGDWDESRTAEWLAGCLEPGDRHSGQHPGTALSGDLRLRR